MSERGDEYVLWPSRFLADSDANEHSNTAIGWPPKEPLLDWMRDDQRWYETTMERYKAQFAHLPEWQARAFAAEAFIVEYRHHIFQQMREMMLCR